MCAPTSSQEDSQAAAERCGLEHGLPSLGHPSFSGPNKPIVNNGLKAPSSETEGNKTTQGHGEKEQVLQVHLRVHCVPTTSKAIAQPPDSNR